MHDGKLTQLQLQQWVLNRYYYQTRIPIKDAIILSKSEDPMFRRMWIRRIHDHDGDQAGEGGLELWLRLAEGVGLDREEVASCRSVLPGVRFACDGYVELVRERTLLEAVASSLTEFFAPDLMSRRVLAWERHYPWISPDMLEYFRHATPARAPGLAGGHRLRRAHADTYESRSGAWRRSSGRPRSSGICSIACTPPTSSRAGGQAAPVPDVSAALAATRGHASPRRRGSGGTGKDARYMLLYPERGLVLNATAADVAQLCTGEHTVAASSSS